MAGLSRPTTGFGKTNEQAEVRGGDPLLSVCSDGQAALSGWPGQARP
jgi:hypothetical protein